ncbi:hypothetical protein PG996_005347 [Apiospora saccharicola]|uniref:Uncharacterized protein n=1 Tax=Apiospora saccharicola TaxID=335842 RepID=A0ABR1VL83_9PEZI
MGKRRVASVPRTDGPRKRVFRQTQLDFYLSDTAYTAQPGTDDVLSGPPIPVLVQRGIVTAVPGFPAQSTSSRSLSSVVCDSDDVGDVDDNALLPLPVAYSPGHGATAIPSTPSLLISNTRESPAKQILLHINSTHHVPEGDPQVHRFRGLVFELIRRILALACGMDDDAFVELIERPLDARKLPIGMLQYLRGEVDTAQNQQTLGKEDLRSVDLLHLPSVPQSIQQWINYIDVVANMPFGTWTTTIAQRSTEIRICCEGHDPSEGTKFYTYSGSSANPSGGQTRINSHFLEASRNDGTNPHYTEARKPGAVMNFRLVNVVDNPYLDQTGSCDVQVHQVYLVEGVIQLYLAAKRFYSGLRGDGEAPARRSEALLPTPGRTSSAQKTSSTTRETVVATSCTTEETAGDGTIGPDVSSSRTRRRGDAVASSKMGFGGDRKRASA